MATRPTARHALRVELAWGAGTVALACILAAIALHLWHADLRIPFSYSSDSNQNQLIVKGVLDHGWYQHNPSLGFPFGQKLYDFPVVSGDNLQIVLMKIIGVFTSDSALVINLFFLLTFPLTAGIAYACTRLLGVSRPASSLVAVLFAIAPYHFIRGEQHLFIAAYYAVPISAYLALRALRGDRFVRRQWGWLAAAVVVVGSAHVYYAAFAMGLLAIAGIVRVIVREPRTAVTALALFGAIGAVVVANHLPNIVYRAQHGQNRALERPAADSEAYGLKLAAMALPVERHRIPALAHLRKRYDDDSQQVTEGQPQALGIVATLGLLGLIAAALTSMAVPERRTLSGNLVLPLAALTLAAFLIGTVGGFSSLFAYIVTPQLRAWARMSIFIAFFSLVAVALAADLLSVRRGARAALAAMAAVVVIAFLDQTNGGSVPDYRAVKASYRSDAALVGDIEHTLGPGAAVFQLPYEPFPEPQPVWIPDIGPYGLGRGYIHSHDLRWSYGMMKGRAGDWQNAVVQLPPELVARAAAAVGFTGMYVDRAAYADHAAHVLAALQHEIGAPVVSSANGQLAFLDMRAYASRLRTRGQHLRALRRAVLNPIGVQFEQGFAGLRQDLTGRAFPMERNGRIVLRNPWLTPRAVTVSMKLVPAYPAPATSRVTWPDGSTQTVPLPRDGAVLTRRITIPPGRSAVSLSVKGRPQFSDPNVPQTYYLRVLDPLVVDGAFAPFGDIPGDHRAASWLEPFGRI